MTIVSLRFVRETSLQWAGREQCLQTSLERDCKESHMDLMILSNKTADEI